MGSLHCHHTLFVPSARQSASGDMWTDLNDNDNDDSTGGWILFWSVDSRDQITGTDMNPQHVSSKTERRLKPISYLRTEIINDYDSQNQKFNDACTFCPGQSLSHHTQAKGTEKFYQYKSLESLDTTLPSCTIRVLDIVSGNLLNRHKKST